MEAKILNSNRYLSKISSTVFVPTNNYNNSNVSCLIISDYYFDSFGVVKGTIICVNKEDIQFIN